MALAQKAKLGGYGSEFCAIGVRNFKVPIFFSPKKSKNSVRFKVPKHDPWQGAEDVALALLPAFFGGGAL